MKKNIKESIISSMKKIVPVNDYLLDECIYAPHYFNSPLQLAYFIMQLSSDFNFKITEDFIDSLEMCTFRKLEIILAEENTNEKV